jgi:hypothetical protein
MFEVRDDSTGRTTGAQEALFTMADIIYQVPSCNNGNGVAAAAADIADHVAEINNLLFQLKALKTATVEAEESIGGHILAIKAAEPNDWESIVKSRCGLSRSRAYELMAIADGTKTTEQVRAADAAKHRRLRAARREAVRDVPDSERERAAARAQRDELEERHTRQIARYEAEIARLSDAKSLSSKQDVLLAALEKIEKLLSEARGLSAHYVQNRLEIIWRIHKAQARATSAMKAATGKSTDSAMKVAA